LDDNDFDLLQSAFAETLRELRTRRRPPRSKKSNKYSQEQLALEMGMDRSYLSALERGEHNPTLWTLWRLRAVLQISASQLIREIEKKYELAKSKQKKDAPDR
jgi:transcriptional regulator with XRE-family HTH domain